MFFTVADLQADPKLRSKTTAWAARINQAALKPGCPTFKATGDHEIKVRPRSSGPGPGPGPGMRLAREVPFLCADGSEFRLSSLVLQTSTGGMKVTAIFSPVSPSLIKEINTVSMPFSDAIEVFGTLDTWAKSSEVETETVVKERAAAKVRAGKIPTVEQMQASETWGAW